MYINKFEEGVNDILIEKDLKKTQKIILEIFAEELIEVKNHIIATSNAS